MIRSTHFAGVFKKTGKKKTLFTNDGKMYRLWDPAVSKLAAAIDQGLKILPLTKGSVVLYLGASTGTTVSHISDILGNEGILFAVEISPTTCRELVFLAEERTNIVPILADAAQPDTYAQKIVPVDLLYQDVSQKNQVNIFLTNAQQFLKKGGCAFIAIKARSINVAREPTDIFKEAHEKISKTLDIIEEINLTPYQKDHCMFVCKKK